MGLFEWLFGKAQEAEERAFSTLSNPTPELMEVFGARPAISGAQVNEANALRASAVLACVRVISETIASLPCHVYRRLEPRGKERATDYPLYELLHDRPNPEMTAFTFWETIVAHACLWGNFYAEIDYGATGYRPLALWPLLPDRTKPERVLATGEIVYKTVDTEGNAITLPAWKVFHVPGLGYDGLQGYSVIRMAREGVGLALATEEYGARFFGNGARPGGVLEHPQKLSDSARENLKKSIQDNYGGLRNSQRLMILEEGMKYSAIAVPPNDAQFLETRKYQVVDIARIFRVPLHMVGDLDRATFSNIEHQTTEFVVFTLLPWLTRIEQAINWKLIGPRERKVFFAKFLVNGLLRGDTKSRYESYAIGREKGWLCADDIREMEDMNDLPEGQGKIFLVPMNMVPADKVEALAEANIKKASTSPQPANNQDKTGGVPDSNRFLPLLKDAAERIAKRGTIETERFGKGKITHAEASRSVREFSEMVLKPIFTAMGVDESRCADAGKALSEYCVFAEHDIYNKLRECAGLAEIKTL